MSMSTGDEFSSVPVLVSAEKFLLWPYYATSTSAISPSHTGPLSSYYVKHSTPLPNFGLWGDT
eukprot:scaffold68271_cov47-Cyclotella_meneghiniana.AAC.1